ncbi:hypothetical protein [Chryseobacterium sp. T1]
MKVIAFLSVLLLLPSCTTRSFYETQKSEIQNNVDVLVKKQSESTPTIDYYNNWGKPNGQK